MSMFRVLHISDIHIGDTYKPSKDIALKVISDIEHNGLSKINMVAITGDIFNGPSVNCEKLVDEAVIFFETLLKEINLCQQNFTISKEDFIFIPGNHDIIRTEDITEQLSKYKSFLNKFYNNIPDYYDVNDFSVHKVYEDEKIAFIGFNSCELEQKKIFDEAYIKSFETTIDSDCLSKNNIDKNILLQIMKDQSANEYRDYGHISMQQLTSMQRKISKYSDFNIVAMFHHHFYLFPEILKEFGDVSVIRNHAEVTQRLKYMNVKTVLHGHKHYDIERPFITDDYYQNSDSIIDVFSSGSLATARKDKHTFSLVDFYDKTSAIKLIQKKFVYNEEQLDIVEKQVPPRSSANKVVELLGILKSNFPTEFELYNECAEKLFTVHSDCCKIIEWVSNALTGFNDTYKQLNDDYRNILFILYAINYRTATYRALIGKKNVNLESSSDILKNFFNDQLVNGKFQLDSNEYHKLFSSKDLKVISNVCDALLNSCSNKTNQTYLAFTMIGIFFSDLYLILTKYADDFKETIKYKVNIKMEENKFHENVPAPRIVVKSDVDRRSVSIQLRCNEATTHKMAVLFVKEFDLLINKFEDYFKLVGLKIYYILPEIDRTSLEDSLINYNFEAYIPTLLPLLTGDNIYPSKQVFARELIQNSIDAIAVRAAKDNSMFSKDICIELGYDENQKRYFKIIDNGTGMDRYKIERYFTSIGRSFYSGEEYEDLQIDYKPISSFGIGFLSSFMVCKEIDVKTKYYTDDSEDLKLHIPNYDGCFFVEKEKKLNVGTELKLYLDTKLHLSDKEILDYIKNTMLDVKYNILLKTIDKTGQTSTETINSHAVRRKFRNHIPLFFVPLTESCDVLNIDYNEEILSSNFVDKYEYGILISFDKKQGYNKQPNCILNSGILINNASLYSLFDMKNQMEYQYNRDNEYRQNSICINFPANWIQLDVSREKLTGFSNQIEKINEKKPTDGINIKIAKELYNQIESCINGAQKPSNNIPVASIQEAIHFALNLCCKKQQLEIYQLLLYIQYRANIDFTPTSIIFSIPHQKRICTSKSINYLGEQAKIQKKEFLNRFFPKSTKSTMQLTISDDIRSHPSDLIHYIERFLYSSYEYPINKKFNRYFKDFCNHLNLEYHVLEQNDNGVFLIFALLFLTISDHTDGKKGKEHFQLIELVELVLMQRFNIYDVEQDTANVEITYEELEIFLLQVKNKQHNIF